MSKSQLTTKLPANLSTSSSAAVSPVTKFRIALIFGGPSPERGVSLNSARSVLDHVGIPGIEIVPLYVDFQKNFYYIQPKQLYSNTPSDFDFKLQYTAHKMSTAELRKTLHSVDLAFPAMQGLYGEDGELQAFLEQEDIPFSGVDSATCQKMFFKDTSARIMHNNGFPTVPSIVIQEQDLTTPQLLKERIVTFQAAHPSDRYVVKPVAGGSSIGVFVCNSIAEILENSRKILNLHIGKRILLEPFCHGREFTIVVLQSHQGEAVAMVPSEVKISQEDQEDGEIFDYRKKYLPILGITWPCPANFPEEIIQQIRHQAEQIFYLFDMRDFARLDGWLLENGEIVFTDLNPISGMEQNSFLFQQPSRAGLTHRDLLFYIIQNACLRNHLQFPLELLQMDETAQRQPVRVLFGGDTAEKQISLMSGTNVWLKLRKSTRYSPEPYFLDVNGKVWHLPYTFALNHTVEEVQHNCQRATQITARILQIVPEIRQRLGLPDDYQPQQHLPTSSTIEEFSQASAEAQAFVFSTLLGGFGENGTIQAVFDQYHVQYNGSGVLTSQIGMDKAWTGRVVQDMNDPDVISLPKYQVDVRDLETAKECVLIRKRIIEAFQTKNLLVKPNADGCSAGVIRISSATELDTYFQLMRTSTYRIPAHTFKFQPNIVEMPLNHRNDYIIEPFIVTDTLRIVKNKLQYHKQTGWLELTVGLLEQHGHYHALNPSITIAEGEVLTLEEKFQGGTGVNITPPPANIVPAADLQLIKAGIERFAKALGIQNYARIDIFFNVDTHKIVIIEANTLPALTPSTVIYHQAIAENPPLLPVEFLETLIALKLE